MNNIGKKTLFILAIVYLTAFIGFFVFSIFSYNGGIVTAQERENYQSSQFRYSLSIQKPSAKFGSFYHTPVILEIFKLRWILYNGLILFARYFLAVHLTGVLLCYSLIFPYQISSHRTRISFFGLMGKNITLFLVLVILFTIFHEEVSPSLIQKQKQMSVDTKFALDSLKKGETALVEGKYSGAYSNFISYLAIDPSNSVVSEAAEWAHAQMAARTVKNSQKKQKNRIKDNLTFYEKATDFYKEKKYFSAYYYAFLASETDEKIIKGKALRLKDRAENELLTLQSIEKDAERNKYYNEKMEALNDLKNGMVYNAYYAFKRLKEKYPGDKDLGDFFEKSKKAVEGKYFFIDELAEYEDFPGIRNIVYLHHEKSGDTVFLKIGKYIQAEKGRYFFNIEVLVTSPEKGVITHFTAPYGMVSRDGYINMQAIDRGKEKKYFPEYLVKSMDSENIFSIKLEPVPDELSFLRKDVLSKGNLTAVELYTMWKTVGKYGYPTKPLEILLLQTLVLPFTFFIFSLFSVGIGWFFRIRRKSIPWISLLFVPLVPFGIQVLLGLYSFSTKIVSTYLLFKTGFTLSLVLLLVVQAVLLFLALVTIAKQDT